MNILLSILKFFVGAANFTANIASLKKYVIATMANTLICLLLGAISYYYPFGGWLGVAINLFFLYAGGTYVLTWHKATRGPLDIFTAEDSETVAEEPKEDTDAAVKVENESDAKE